MSILGLTIKSILNRRLTATLTVLSIAISVLLLLGVERIRVEARQSFTNTLSGTDLIVGARTGDINLLLSSVFHIGNASSNVSWESYEEIRNHPAVAWTIPVSLGDSHRGHRVMGTSSDLFRHFRYRGDSPLVVADGQPFSDLFDAVIGAEVARKLGYTVGQDIVLSHGVDAVAMHHHEDKPFRVSGILSPTGTPIDKTILVSLAGIEAMHIDWHNSSAPVPGLETSAEEAREMALQPTSVTAFYMGLTSRMATFRVQRLINEYGDEALLAILPGVALQNLWQLVGAGEKALLFVSGLVLLAGLVGMLTTVLTSLNERRREIAILRSIGAKPVHTFLLLLSETLIYTVAGCALGIGLLYGGLLVAQPLVQAQLGIYLPISLPAFKEVMMLAGIILLSATLGLLPAWRAYKHSLADGLTVRV
ncbi:ABC transporter permease [Kistimonas asteriae]|uniref:ABC transporter permease n=1 Tax=Kistimonas asteriae TaxID=517724 RepID=UPI001BA85A5D|nr:ABC transporter permease [Kistimonas asteriae]